MMESQNQQQRRRVYVLRSAIGGALVLAVLALLYFTVFTASVSIDGHWTRVRSGYKVADLATDGLIAGRRGNLVSARTGRVLKTGGGHEAFAVVNGRGVATDAKLVSGDLVVSHDGTDTVEPILERTEPIPFGVSFVGRGPMESVVTSGEPGVRLVSYGADSKEIVSDRTVKPATAEVVRRSNPPKGAKLVALTFDDGPWPSQTAAVLRILQANHVVATFFEIGQQARRHPDLSRMLVRSGMLIGNHSETHPLNLDRLTAAAVAAEITKAQTDIGKASGTKPRYFRPPGGNTAPAMLPVLARLGMKWVQWDVDTDDWKRPPATAIVARVMSGVRPGAVILMHDGGGDRSHTIAALPSIIAKLKARGYVFVTLDGLSSLPHVMG